jgi:hypothetical protein
MKFCVISPWAKLKNAEYEVIERIKKAAVNIGHECIVVDQNGCIVGFPKKSINKNDVEFCIALHFISPKLFDIHTYGAMWNPPSFLAKWGYDQMIFNVLSYDDYLIYDSHIMLRHLQNVLTSSRKHLKDGFMNFVPGCAGDILTPNSNLRDAKVFYCGINWERTTNSKGRHHDLFGALDKSGHMEYYGPQKFLGAKPWGGFKSYKGELDFNGEAVLRAINRCGISLVLSSDEHRQYGAVSSRLYESCAAGAVIISDDNPFIVQEFGDNVLSFAYSDKAEDNYKQILEKIVWIEGHPQEATKRAIACQQIYLRKYSMEVMLKGIIDNHKNRQAEVYAQIQAKTQDDTIDVVVNWHCKYDEKKLIGICDNLNRQHYKNLNLVLLVKKNCVNHKQELLNCLSQHLTKEISFNIFMHDDVAPHIFARPNSNIDTAANKYSAITNGEMFYYFLQQTQNRFFILLPLNQYWSSKHISSLKRALDDNSSALAAYSGYFAELAQKDIQFETDNDNILVMSMYDIVSILAAVHNIPLSTVLFRKDVTRGLPSYNFGNFDQESGYFIFSLLLVNTIKLGRMICTQIPTANVKLPKQGKQTPEYEHTDMHYLRDIFRMDAKYKELCERNSASGILLGTESYNTFKSNLKRLIRAQLGNHPMLHAAARKVYRLYKRWFRGD